MDGHVNLIHVIQRLACCRSLEAIVETLREFTRELIGADGVTIVLRDKDQCHYAEENAVGPLWKGRRFPLTACISGWCMLNRQQVAIADIYVDGRIPHDAYRPTFVKSLAMTPIRAADPVGAIGAYWADHHEATAAELSTLQTLGDSAAMALENTQLIEALKESGRRKDEFLSMLAHELRNPLAPLRNGLQLLCLQSGRSEAAEQACSMMDRQVGHLSRMVDDLLDVARINTGKVSLKRARFDLAALVRQCAQDYRHVLTSARLALKLEIPAGQAWMEGDAARLTQVLGNLLENARKYTPAGNVCIRLRIDEAAEQASIDIEDSGVGIGPELLPRIFESFTQADESLERTGGGLGLGLAVAHGIVKLHNGAISAHSDGPGRGARFTIMLPGVQLQSEPADTAEAVDNKLHVLIIEDNYDTADSLDMLLKVCGYRTSVAYDGRKGVETAYAGLPDVVLCDIGLPELDGYEVAAALRGNSRTAGARLIAVTGYGTDDDRQRTRQAGFDAHMVKPVDLKSLLTQIQEGRPALAIA